MALVGLGLVSVLVVTDFSEVKMVVVILGVVGVFVQAVEVWSDWCIQILEHLILE